MVIANPVYVLFYVPGYANYPQVGTPAASYAPTGTPTSVSNVAAAAVAAAAAAQTANASAVMPRFIRQPLAIPTQLPNGTYQAPHPQGLAHVAAPVTTQVLRPNFQPHTFHGVNNPGFHKFRTGFNKGGSPGKGIKRKYDEVGSPSPDSNGKVDGAISSMHPLYCKVCRVTLNAPSQAKQHYEGKNHAKKQRLHVEGKEDGDSQNGDSKSDQVRTYFLNFTDKIVYIYCRDTSVTKKTPQFPSTFCCFKHDHSL